MRGERSVCVFIIPILFCRVSLELRVGGIRATCFLSHNCMNFLLEKGLVCPHTGSIYSRK